MFKEVGEAVLAVIFEYCAHILNDIVAGPAGRLRVVTDVIGKAVVEFSDAEIAAIGDRITETFEPLVKLLKETPSKLNLISFNPFPHAPYARSRREDILAFQKILADAGYICTIRSTRGDDIDAACGQLVGQVQDRTRRAERWQSRQDGSREIFRSAT